MQGVDKFLLRRIIGNMDYTINLDNLKIARGLRTKTDIATALNVSRQTIYNYEIGKTAPPMRTLLKLADLYGVSLDHFIRKVPASKTVGAK